MCAKANGVDICVSHSYGNRHVFAYCATFMLVCMCFANPIIACINCTDDDCVSPSCYCDPGSGCVECIDGCSCDRDDTDHVCCSVSKIQYDDPDNGYVDVSGTLYVHKGTSVTFKAKPHACKDPFPSGKPKWSGSSGASGTGSTKTVTFNTLSTSTTDFKTVTAKCGNELTVPVIVYELTGFHCARDNFAGRNSIKYGVAEISDLRFTTSPAGVTSSQIGGLEWKIVSGNGSISNSGTSGIGTYTCHWSSESVTLKIEVKTGPSKNKSADMGFSVVKPSLAVLELIQGSVITHPPYPLFVAGFQAEYFLRPTDVSFSKIGFSEGSCWATLTGWFTLYYPNGAEHPTGQTIPVLGGNLTKGCKVDGIDGVTSTGDLQPYSEGSLTWVIPVRYNVGGGGWTQFDTVTHIARMTASGLKTIQKQNIGPY